VTIRADSELMLAAACCRWPPSPARDAAVRGAAETVDWARFARVVKRQRIAGLVDAALKAAAMAPPASVVEPITRVARQVAEHNLRAASETVRIVRLIAAAGYPVLVVKGTVLGVQAYGTIGLKHSKDIDLLVLPTHATTAIAVLEANGYHLSAPASTLSASQRAVLVRYGKDVTLVHAGSGVQVELHWRLFGDDTLLPGVTAASATQRVDMARAMAVPTLTLPDGYAHLVLHGANEGWFRMKWIADVAALLAPLDAREVGALHDHATRLGAGLASAQALLLAQELFDFPLAPTFAAALRRSRRVRWLLAGAYRLMAAKDGATELADWKSGQLHNLAMQAVLGRGARHYWQIVRGVLYMQSDMYASSLPPALYRLYPIVRIPRWIARQAAGFVSGSQAPAAHAMLRRRGVFGVIHFGTARSDALTLDAHAWLDAGGVEVTGYPVGPGFTEIACIA
jgi:hypothetical protein